MDIETLLIPISDNSPCGEDLTFASIFDDIKEARRQDDPALDQGEWKTEVKVADWNKVKNIAIDAFQTKTKDLQVGAWLTESMLQLEGFAGLATGLNLNAELIDKFWDSLFPAVEDEDLDTRISRLNWMETNLPQQIRQISLTSTVDYGWIKWQEAKTVDNLSRKSQEAATAALADGKINGEQWNNAILESDASFYQNLIIDLANSVQAITTLISVVDEKFGNEAPSLMQLKGSILDCQKLILTCAAQKGLVSADAENSGTLDELHQSADHIAVTPKSAVVGVSTKAEALNALTLVAEYFRKTEPHSPVSYLVQRAISWGGMDLNEWLNEVIKDDSTLSQLREGLGIKDADSE